MESDAVAAVSAESQKRKREEYEMQLFGFHSRAVYATLKSIVMEGIQSRSRKLCETLEKVHKTDAANLAMLKANEERLVKAYNTAAAPYLKNLENIVNKFIAVPNNVLADEDKIQEIQYTEAEFENIRGKLEELQQRARRAAVLNASLNEELQLIEQFSICADNTDRLSHIIESSIKCPDVSDKIHQLVEYYKRFSAFLDDGVPVSEKSIYNAIDDLKCIDCNMDAL
ncbi:protein MIS12 homolog [Solenopsis invicta]|uniref:protein MIS12 homolog n=1 Tax=Solenopsis invicta TaxID=13686 RepID=UPI000E33F8DE|nr:protein MIS12 homolog [Solenopsis invicta]